MREICSGLVLCTLWTGVLAFAQVPAANEQAPPADPAPYRICAGDLLELKYHFNSDLNEQTHVRPDGAIAVAMAGELRAEGLTPRELGAILEKRLAPLIRHPQLAVVVREFAGQRVYIGGEVMSPQALHLRGPITCWQAVMAAGGPKPSAKLGRVVLLRYSGKDRAELSPIDLSKVMKGKAVDIPLQPYDVVFVPKSRIARAGQFVNDYVNAMIPRNLIFPYNVNTTITYNVP